MHVLVNPGDVTCVPALVTSSLCQPQRSRGYACLCSCVMRFLYVLSVTVSVAGHVKILCRSVCVFVSVSCDSQGYVLNFTTG